MIQKKNGKIKALFILKIYKYKGENFGNSKYMCRICEKMSQGKS